MKHAKKKHRILAIEGIKHDDEPGFPKSYVRCACGWKSKPYIDHRLEELIQIAGPRW